MRLFRGMDVWLAIKPFNSGTDLDRYPELHSDPEIFTWNFYHCGIGLGSCKNFVWWLRRQFCGLPSAYSVSHTDDTIPTGNRRRRLSQGNRDLCPATHRGTGTNITFCPGTFRGPFWLLKWKCNNHINCFHHKM